MILEQALSDETEAKRAKAFHLLKKFTSWTFVNHSIGLYRSFLDAYEKQLDTPSPNQQWLEETYRVCFLGCLIELERGQAILRNGMAREAAFKALIEGGKFVDYLWGMSAEWWGVEHDQFFVRLGRSEPTDTGAVASALLSKASLTLCARTSVSFERWNYDNVFDDSEWPPKRTYPISLANCPVKNTSTHGEVLSGEEITTDGIWEPWFMTGKVGCPNYFLKGQVAHRYQPEGTDDREPVRWRLLWEDIRYLDGSIPAEEADYLDKPAEVIPVRLKAMPGDICPRTGYWEAFVVDGRYHVVAGAPMPGPKYTHIGAVIWNFVSDTVRATDV